MAPVPTVDLEPTLLRLCGGLLPRTKIEGHDLSPLLVDVPDDTREAVSEGACPTRANHP